MAGIPPLRRFLAHLADEITSDHLARLKYLCEDIPPRKHEAIKTPEDLFTAITERTGSEENLLKYLEVRFKAVGLFRLEREIEKFRKEATEPTNHVHQECREKATPEERTPPPQPQPPPTTTAQTPTPELGRQAQSHPQSPEKSEDQIHTTRRAPSLNESPEEFKNESEVDSIPREPQAPCEELLERLAISEPTSSEKGHPTQPVKPYARQSSSHHPIPEQSSTAQKCPVHLSYNAMKEYFQAVDTCHLGHGGFGTVYKGCKKFMEREVVVKQERLQGGQDGSPVYEQFKREKKVSFMRHSHVMPVYAICEERGSPRCIMYPYMVNSDLDKALEKDGRRRDEFTLSSEDRVRAALHAARGLKYLHRQKIVHMDIKPGNILLDEKLNARLGDPGMARELKPGVTHASMSQVCGTDGYIDPFYERSMEFRPVNDIFSFGVVMLRLLTQKPAINKSNSKYRYMYKTLEQNGALGSSEMLYQEARKGKWPNAAFGKKFAELAIKCLKGTEERIDLNELCQGLESMLKMSKPFCRETDGSCTSCMLHPPLKYLPIKSSGCGSSCSVFCQSCLIQSGRNPLECPEHGPAEPVIGQANSYAVLICGHDSNNPDIFEKDAKEFYEVLNDNRIVGIRKENISLIMPARCKKSQAEEIRRTLENLKKKLEDTKNARLFFYFSGHSDQEGNLVCSSEEDLLVWKDLHARLYELPNLSETIIILDCCYADGKIATGLLQKSFSAAESSNGLLPPLHPPCTFRFEDKKEANQESQCADRPTSPSQGSTDGNQPLGKSAAGKVVQKAPHGQREPASVWQMLSSTRKQESLALKGGHSFFTQSMLQGLRGGHGCQEPDCRLCEEFRLTAAVRGYISTSSLEDYIYKHVELKARGKGLEQQPRYRSTHSRDIPLAYFNENELCDNVLFTFEDGHTEVIAVAPFPETLEEFQKIIHDEVKGTLRIASPKHIQILCEDDEVDSAKYEDLKQWLREGYGVKCQLRTPNYILEGPVTWAVEDVAKYKDFFCSGLAESLGINEDTGSSHPSFSVSLPQECEEEDKNEFIEMAKSDLKDEKVLHLFCGLQELSTAGELVITLFETSVHFEFIQS